MRVVKKPADIEGQQIMCRDEVSNPRPAKRYAAYSQRCKRTA